MLTLLDAEGRELGLTELPESHVTLLFVSSPACDYCLLAAPIWERVARSLAGAPVRVLGLVLDADPRELETSDTPYPLLTAGDAGLSLARQLPSIPASVLIDSTGVVQWTIYGGEQAELERAVETFSMQATRQSGPESD